MLLDVDFVPSSNLYDHLSTLLGYPRSRTNETAVNMNLSKTIFVVPAFEVDGLHLTSPLSVYLSHDTLSQRTYTNICCFDR